MLMGIILLLLAVTTSMLIVNIIPDQGGIHLVYETKGDITLQEVSKTVIEHVSIKEEAIKVSHSKDHQLLVDLPYDESINTSEITKALEAIYKDNINITSMTSSKGLMLSSFFYLIVLLAIVLLVSGTFTFVKGFRMYRKTKK